MQLIGVPKVSLRGEIREGLGLRRGLKGEESENWGLTLIAFLVIFWWAGMINWVKVNLGGRRKASMFEQDSST